MCQQGPTPDPADHEVFRRPAANESAKPVNARTVLSDAALEKFYSENGDDKGQGLHPSYKSAVRDGFNLARGLLSAHQFAHPAPVASKESMTPEWLWHEFMDYCKERGIAPANNNRLFEIVDRARRASKEAVTLSEEQDAARWRAFVNCARIRLFGWSGYGSTKGGRTDDADVNGYRHFGGEFWTIYSAPSDPKAQEILTGFADAAIALAQRDASKAEPKS